MRPRPPRRPLCCGRSGAAEIRCFERSRRSHVVVETWPQRRVHFASGVFPAMWRGPARLCGGLALKGWFVGCAGLIRSAARGVGLVFLQNGGRRARGETASASCSRAHRRRPFFVVRRVKRGCLSVFLGRRAQGSRRGSEKEDQEAARRRRDGESTAFKHLGVHARRRIPQVPCTATDALFGCMHVLLCYVMLV